MRPLSIARATGLSLLACCALPATAGEGPRHIRVCIQFVEMPHPLMTGLLTEKDSSGPATHQRAMALVEDGKAKLLESCMVIARSGQKATVETFREVIYPAEYEPPSSSLQPTVNLQPSQLQSASQPVRPFPFKNFETRNTGITVEIEPTLDANEQTVDLTLAPDIVALHRFETMIEHVDRWGNASFRFPVFETWRLLTRFPLLAGQFELISTITAKPHAPATPHETKGGTGSHGLRSFSEAGLPVQATAEQNQHGRAARAPLVAPPATPRKILVFVRADVVPVDS